MLNIGNVTLLQDMIGIHSCETLLLDRVYLVRNTLECSGISKKKVRQVLRDLKEACCRSKEDRGRSGWNRMDQHGLCYTFFQGFRPLGVFVYLELDKGYHGQRRETDDNPASVEMLRSLVCTEPADRSCNVDH